MELLPADLESKEPIASSSAAASVAIITKEPKLATPAVPDESVVIAGVSALAFLAELNNGMFVSFLVGDFLGRGVTQESVGVLFGLSAIGVLVVGPFGPRVISALGGAPATMRLAALALAASSFGLAGLSLVSDPFTLLVSAAVFFALKSVASVLSELGGGTTVMCAVPEARRTAANGQFMAAKNLGGLLAPVFGGSFYSLGGFALPFIAGGFILLVGVLIVSKTIASIPQYGASDSAAESSHASILSVTEVRLALAAFSFGGALLFFPLSYLQVSEQPLQPLGAGPASHVFYRLCCCRHCRCRHCRCYRCRRRCRR